MKSALTLFLASALLTLGNAQTVKPVGLSVRAGLFFPSSAIGRATAKSWFSFGADYKIGELKRPGASYSLSMDLYSKGNLSSLPVCLNYVMRQEKYYVFAGAGVNFARTFDGTDRINSTEFAYQIGGGMEFNRFNMPMFVEVKFSGSGEADLAGLAAFVGFRF